MAAVECWNADGRTDTSSAAYEYVLVSQTFVHVSSSHGRRAALQSDGGRERDEALEVEDVMSGGYEGGRAPGFK